MKKYLIIQLLLLSVLFSCGDSSEPGVQIAINSTEGFLGTMGRTITSRYDTLVYYYNGVRLEHVVSLYVKGKYLKEKDKIHLEPTGSNNNVYYIVFKQPYFESYGHPSPYLGISIEPILPGYPGAIIGCEYVMHPKEIKSDDMKFVIEFDGDKFTIESVSHPGYYLNVKKWPEGADQNETAFYFCQGSSQQFFFLQE